MRAIIELFDFFYIILNYARLNFIDSTYVIRSLQGDRSTSAISFYIRIFTPVLEYFPRVFGDKIKQILIFAQAYTQSSRHATTALRCHYGQTKDLSNISTSEAFRFFPYDIFPPRIGCFLTVQLIDNPTFSVQRFTGLQPLIQQAMKDFGTSYSDYGVKGKGRNEGKALKYPQTSRPAHGTLSRTLRRGKITPDGRTNQAPPKADRTRFPPTMLSLAMDGTRISL